MTINTKDLPSKALLGERLIEIPEISMGIFSRYSNLPSETEAQRMLKELTIYIEAIENWDSLCAYDYTSLIYLIKSNSLLNNNETKFTVRCPNCEKENIVTANLSTNLNFDDITDELLSIKRITIGGVTIQRIVPTMGDLKSALEILVKANDKLDRRDIMFRLFFNFAEKPNAISSLVFNAKKKDIAIISYLSDLCCGLATYNPPICCSKCKEVIRIAKSDFFASDPFRNILLNFPLREEQINDSKGL